MKYAICYSSKTGNTELLAKRAAALLPGEDCIYCGVPGPLASQAELILAGFWTDKGTCDEAIKEWLPTLEGKKIILFGTAGFGGSPAYYDGILSRIQPLIPEGSTVLATFMCQGKMPASVRQRYEVMAASNPGEQKFAGMIENFDKALSHPDESDLKEFENKLRETLPSILL